MVFGYVYGAGGQIPVGPPGALYDDPANPVTKKPCVGDQIDAWHMDYGNNIDGIYVDVGPVECTHTHPDIPANYQDYVNYIRQFSSYNYRVFLLTPQYPDSSIAEPNFTPWLQKLNADYLGLWEQGTWEYENQYWALDYCDPKQPGIGVPAWWDPGLPWRRTKRMHTINDCADEATMRKMADLAKKRGAWTVCITQRVNDKYDQLPPYWDAMTEVFAPLIRLYVRKS
jgi:hypothetical protein